MNTLRALQRFLLPVFLPLLCFSSAWAQPLPWQPAPNASGEFLASPPQATRPVFYAGESVAGTALGLIATGKHGSRILPVTYGHAARPVAVAQKLLWVEQPGQGMIALGPDFRVAEKRPSVLGHCIAVRSDGFWCLDADSYSIADDEQFASPTLTQYDRRGRQIQQWRTNGQSLPQGYIYWAAVDSHAVWVAVMDDLYSHDAYQGPAIPGPSEMMRIDRTTGLTHSVDIGLWNRPMFIDLPTRILWLNGRDKDGLVVRSLDKTTFAVNTAAHLPVPDSFDAASDGKRLWVFPGGIPRVFSLTDYHEVALDKAGPLPPGSPDPTHLMSGLGPRLLTASGQTAWFRLPGGSLLEMSDTGRSQERAVADTPPHPLPVQWRGDKAWYGTSEGNDLYLLTPSGLTRYSANTAQTVSWTVPAAEDIFYPYLFAVTGTQVWLQASQTAPIRAFSRDLSRITPVLFPDGTPPTVRDFVAAREGLYFWSNNSSNPGCWRINTHGTQIAPLSSWRNLFPIKQSGMDLASDTLETDYAYGPPEGGFLAQFSNAVPEPGLAPVMRYDSATDQWAAAGEPLVSKAFEVRGQLYGYRPGKILRWQSGHWQDWAKCPLPDWRGGRTDSLDKAGWLLAATQRFLYVSTPLGIYRISWSQMVRFSV